MIITTAGAFDAPDIDLLLDAAFEPSRRARTAYRLREGVEPIAGLSMVMRDPDLRGRLIGSIQYWPVDLVAADGARRLTLLGPLAVAPDHQGEGVGKRLLDASLAAADAAGHRAIVLIGDSEYYGPFDFDAAATVGWSVPGPVERHRLLVRVASGLRLPIDASLRAAPRVAAAA